MGSSGASMPPAWTEQVTAELDRLDSADQNRCFRVGAVSILLQLGQRDYPVTWSTAFPSDAYRTDVGNDPLIGKGTAVVLPGQTAAGCMVRVNVTSLLGLINGFTIIAWC